MRYKDSNNQWSNTKLTTSKAVIYTDNDGNDIEFSSITNAAKYLEMPLSSLSILLKSSSTNYIKYKDDNHPQPKPILQYSMQNEFIAEYKTAYQAELSTGINKSGIYNCCIGNCYLAGGFKWKYKEE